VTIQGSIWDAGDGGRGLGGSSSSDTGRPRQLWWGISVVYMDKLDAFIENVIEKLKFAQELTKMTVLIPLKPLCKPKAS
jgi:hypothetical protein